LDGAIRAVAKGLPGWYATDERQPIAVSAHRGTALTKYLRNSARNTVVPKPPETDAEEAGSPAESTPSIDRVFGLMYEELRRVASSVRRNESHETLNSTALVHEAWLRLKDSPQLAATTPVHFKRIAAQAMRQVLVDAARERNAGKRGSPDSIGICVNDWPEGSAKFDTAFDVEMLALDEALDRLMEMDERQSKVAELRIFSELTVPEVAAELGVPVTTVERDWRATKAWLKTQLFPKR
jgi:RNA polymerase sigma factor (TIGR02999 family)